MTVNGETVTSETLLVTLPAAVTTAPGAARQGVVRVCAHGASMELPSLVADAGELAVTASFEFFTARIANANTREAYGRAVGRFCAWLAAGSVPLLGLSSVHVANYLDALAAAGMSVPSVKLHLAGLRHWLDWLTRRGVVPFNPAAAVRGPRHSQNEGKTPVLERAEVKALFASLDTELEDIRTAEEEAAAEAPPASAALASRRQREQERRSAQRLVALRDKAMLSVMLFNIPRVSAVARMQVRDFDDTGDGWLVLHEKRGKTRRLEAHHQVRQALRAYLAAAWLEPGSRVPLFQSAPRGSGRLSGEPLHRNDVGAMVKRRCAAAGLSASICSHSFRATGLTLHHENGGSLQAGAELAGHESTRTTQRYVRTRGNGRRQEVELIHW
jgi:site-specific recombinase XerD